MTAAARDVRFWNGASRKYAANPVADVPGYERTLERTRTHLKAGDVAGWYHDFVRLDLAEETLHFRRGGIVLSRRLHTDSQAGDCLVQVGLLI